MEKAKILIVDDTPDNLMLLLETLKDDYKVVAAISGQDALESIEEGLQENSVPDLILLDIMMPEMDGYEVCGRLKSNPQTQDIPIIFITALGDVDSETKGLQLGAIDYIQKPFNPTVVKMRVANHVALAQARLELKKQNQFLLEMDKLKEDMGNITRHDLKTPLAGILGYSHLLISGDLEEGEYQRFCENIERSAYTMLNMINSSLDLYKMEMGNYELAASELNLIPVLQQVISDSRLLTNQKRLNIEILHDDNDTFNVFAEELLCYSLFSNLIKNAIEASPKDAEIRIFLIETDAFAVVKIHNQGEVPEQMRDRFFEKYATSKKYGTGLGAYSAYLSVKTQNGDIELDCSEVGATSIIVKLPKSH